MYAAGLTLDISKVDAFRKRFETIVQKRIQEEHLTPRILVDHVIDIKRINQKFFNILRQMAPFGPENMQPVFVSENLRIVDRPRILKEEHLKFRVIQEPDDEPIEVIGFGFAEYFDLISSGMRFKLAYTIEENNFMGNRSLQLYMKDIKFD